METMEMKKKLPVGIESFEKIRTAGFYYVDKTTMIRDLLQKWVKVINEEARRLQFLLDSEVLSYEDKELFSQLLKKEMDDETLCFSLRELSELLRKHFGQKVIILIDEYDVPLDKAFQAGYYEVRMSARRKRKHFYRPE